MHPAPPDQHRRAAAFLALHESTEVFVVPNPWDAGTARLLSGLGFVALATTSAGLASSLGRRDGANLVDRTETLLNARTIVDATDLPVSVDLESGFAETADQVGETIRLAAAAGLVGGSIEDTTGRPTDPVHPLEVAVERVAAAAEAARALPFPFLVTARADNYLYGRLDLSDTIRRLQAYQAAGADVLYAPGLPDLGAVRAVCGSVERPVNVLAGGVAAAPGVAELSACGVRRISLGSALSRVALGSVVRAARQVLKEGRLDIATGALPYGEVNALMSAAAPAAPSAAGSA